LSGSCRQRGERHFVAHPHRFVTPRVFRLSGKAAPPGTKDRRCLTCKKTGRPSHPDPIGSSRPAMLHRLRTGSPACRRRAGGKAIGDGGPVAA
jgi:hypothetical protein